jgi:hypothetical protein
VLEELVRLEEPVVLEEPVRLEDPVQPRTPSTSIPPVLTEKQKALAKLSALVPRTNTSALSVTQLSNEEGLGYISIITRVFKFLNHCPEEGISAQFLGTRFMLC